MTATIISAFLPMAVRVITWILDYRDASIEKKKIWAQFVHDVLDLPAVSAKLRQSYQDQINGQKK